MHAEEVLVTAEAATGTVSITIEGWEGVEGYRVLAIAGGGDGDLVYMLPGAAFWLDVGSDPFTATDVLHPPAWPSPGLDADDWAADDYLWDLTARINPGRYQLTFSANPGTIDTYGSHIPAGPIERQCTLHIEVRAGETTHVTISGIPPSTEDTVEECPVVSS